MSSYNKQRILVAPLDWGIGHATRCVTLIDGWIADGHEVILATNGRSAAWLQQRYPRLELLIDIPDYAVTYPVGGSMEFHFAKQLLRLLLVVRHEHTWLQRLVANRSIDCVYSDNRYGLYHERIPCILITHQLYVRVPWWSKVLIYPLMHRYINRFHSIWVPDYAEGKTLSGALSHGGKWDRRVRYVGTLSRFTFDLAQEPNPAADRSQGLNSNYEIVALISGPEPARTAFENQLRQLLNTLNRPALLILGKPDATINEQNGHLTCINNLSDGALANALQNARLVICRSGYSTLMDLETLNVQALLVPTPGQTEQEYLAEYHARQGTHHRVEQKQLTKEVILMHLRRGVS